MTNTANFFKNKFKILIIIVIALGLTLVLSQTLFWQNTSLINPSFVLKTKSFVQRIINWPGHLLASLQKEPDQQSSAKVPSEITKFPTIIPINPINPNSVTNTTFQPMGKGISTTMNPSGQKYIKIEAGTVVEVTEYTLVDGRRIRVIKPINY